MAQLRSRAADRTEHEITAGPVTIGRDDSCDIVIDDAKVSRAHARLDLQLGQWRVTDLQSSNGTYVNEQRTTTAPLRSGDDLRIGNTTLTFTAVDDPRATQASVDSTSSGSGPELSQREREVLALLAGGLSDREIADNLIISLRTVQSHLDRIRDKTGCRKRAELTRWAVKHRVV